MADKQRTIASAVSFEGIGLHTGNPSTITFHPAPEDYGFKFVRADLEGSPEIPALVEYVRDISRGTNLAVGDAEVYTVEHVLSALVGLEIDNCKIELTANEPPVGDGSSQPFVDTLLSAGIKEQQAERKYLRVDEITRYTDESRGIDMVALPHDDFRVTVMIDYSNPALGSQHTGLFDLKKEYVPEFASARTFCFLTEVEALREQGLIRGGNLDNAIVIVDKDMSDDQLQEFADSFGVAEGITLGNSGLLNNNKMRYKNEPARHKVVDILGDLALVGAPIKAQILAARPGHYANIELARKLRELYLSQLPAETSLVPEDQAQLDVNAIMGIVPHRYPFLLVDRIVDYDRNSDTVTGIKNVTINEPFFQGHFPGYPVMPGVLIVEAMAQVGGLLTLNTEGTKPGDLAFLIGVNNARFRKQVVPGDQLRMEVTLAGKRLNTCSLKAKASVDGKVVAQADIMVAVVPQES